MEQYRRQFKKKTTGFGNLEESKIIRAIEGLERRRKRRSDLFTSNRRINGTLVSSTLSIKPKEDEQEQRKGQPDAQNITEDRATRLVKWRAERELEKKLQQRLKQPVFRVGVYSHRLDSPIFLHQTNVAAKQVEQTPVIPRITRATAKRLAAKSAANTPSVGGGVTRGKKTVANSSRGVRNPVKKSAPQRSFAPNNHRFKAPDGLPELPLFGQDALESTKNDIPGTLPIYFSPYVVTARGKRASRLEQLHILRTSMGEEEARERETEEEDPAEEERTVSYFRTITNREVNRLKARCFDWMMVQSTPELSEDAGLIINQAIGQTNLLINKKIEQFRGLINDCETGSGDKLVTCQDLQGFWDMIYMQVQDCDSRFEKLAELRERNWVEEEKRTATVPKAIPKKPPAPATKKVTAKTSSVREMILAARRKKIQSDVKENSPVVTITESQKLLVADTSRMSAVKFDGGFFVVESPQKSATPKTDKKTSLLPRTPDVSSVRKLRRSALSAMKISQILKPLEIDGSKVESDGKIAYANCGQTPGKSILKKSDAPQANSCAKKSQNKVNFSKNEERTRINGSDELSEFDVETNDAEENFSGDSEVKKRLEFLNLSSGDSDQELQQTLCSRTTACDTRIIPEAGDSESGGKTITRNGAAEKRVTRQSGKDSEIALSDASNIRSTEPEARNIEKSSMENKEQKENEIPITATENTKRRKSTRKSVKFTGEECTACSETKPVLPMTPSAKRRTSKHSSQKENVKKETSPTLSSYGDPVAWETPIQLPSRVRRSLRIQKTQQ